MHAVATGAVGDDLRASAGREAVIAGKVSGLATAFDAEFLREAHAFVAARAGGLRQVRGRHRRIRIEMRFDGVNAVAVGADRRLPVPLAIACPWMLC